MSKTKIAGNETLDPIANALKPIVADAIPASLNLTPDPTVADAFLAKALTTPDAGEPADPGAIRKRVHEVIAFAGNLDENIRRAVLKAPVIQENVPELAQAAGEKMQVRIVDNAIPASYYDPESNALVMTKAFVNERTADELKAQVMTVAESSPNQRLGIASGTESSKNILAIFKIDQQVADTVGIDPATSNLDKLQKDREAINHALKAQLGASTEHVRELGEQVSNVIASIPNEDARILNLNYYAESARKPEKAASVTR